MPLVISVVIPVKNGGAGLTSCLEAIRAQRIDEEVEIVVVDSGSTDGSAEAAREQGARVCQIMLDPFSHGAARNLGAAAAAGEVLAFLSQDAVPASELWLAQLVAPLRHDPRVAGVYGRQLPNTHASPPESYFLNFLYGGEPRRQQARSPSQLSMMTTLFSNVNSAIPRSLWKRFPFVEDIVMSEDQEWSGRMLLAGYVIAYEPAAAVTHSHRYTMSAAFRRFFDSGASSSRCYLAGRRSATRVLRSEAVRYASGELSWLWRTGRRRWIPYAAVYESTKMLGLLAGANHARIPLELKRRMSGIPGHWERERDGWPQRNGAPHRAGSSPRRHSPGGVTDTLPRRGEQQAALR
jgi:rhamnosyltransferase